MSEFFKLGLMNDAQLIIGFATIIAGLITAYVAIISFRKSIQERHLDLRWKQANAAKDFVHEIHENKYAMEAIVMLDWFSISSSENFKEINFEEVLAAIPKLKDLSINKTERHILESFDWFFYYIDRTEQHILDGFFLFDNVKFIFYPYYEKICGNRELFDFFSRERRYFLAVKFWDRFDNASSFF